MVGQFEQIVGQITAALLPKIKEAVAAGAVAAEPAVKRVLREEVLPKFGFATVLGFAVLGAVAAAVGSYFATRRNPAARRNPAHYTMVRRRRAA